MSTASIIGGTGQIGLAVAERLARDGWEVRLVSRAPPPISGPWQHVGVDREDRDAFRKALAGGADLLLDCIAFDQRHADQLLELQDDVGRLAVISSASVYCDAQGRTLDEASQCGFPAFPVPIHENHRTVEPGPQTYSTRKAAIERRILDGASATVTILRPCAIHGPYSKHAREWWFVKRLLDGRRRIPLAYGGRSRFQTTSTQAIAEAVCFSLNSDQSQVLNVVDADAPTVAEIARAIMDSMDRHADLLGLPDVPYPPTRGVTPWSVEKPIVCASSVPSKATYAEGVGRAVRWLIAATQDRDWREVLPQLAVYPAHYFDYAVDDQALATAGVKHISI
ncbi:NAD-dependent epimerase/dehydratase family protein [Sinorhizobium terangae]|uniref:NAD-dependent epimerase/dehydratase family protein n=1 Tax=Sinorhizobium terangae TaxID=110322 RepID=A0A6N7LG64_SINTE|nr:NAD-dependent epimerase/dehydratase family protein [Sinorhizobium terangae]MQX16787.1 NAD-dependent epimerase/dehydratase family protein [Sinorhizobium terangae]